MIFTPTFNISSTETTKSVTRSSNSFRHEETWDNGYVNNADDEEPVTYYPLEKLYLIAEKEDGTILWQLPFTIQTQQDEFGDETQSVYIRFYYREENPNTISIQALSSLENVEDNEDNTKTLTLSDNETAKLYFSSIESVTHQLKEKVTVNGKELLKPVGDILFRSETRHIKLEKGTIMLSGLNAPNSFTNVCESPLGMRLNRCTTIVTPLLLVTSDEPVGTTYSLLSTEFEDKAGPMSNWKVRYYINYPTSYTMESTYIENAKGNCIITKLDKIALSSDKVKRTFTDGVSYSESNVSGGDGISYTGIGGGDASFPFIYWISTELSTSCTPIIYAEITNTQTNQTKTLKASLSGYTLTNNYHEMIHIIIGISDLTNGFGMGTTENNLRSANSDSDVLDIPYKVFVKSNPL